MPQQAATETYSHLKSLMKKNLLHILMPALIVGMALMSALTVQASARYGGPVPGNPQQDIADVISKSASRPNAHHTNATCIIGDAVGMLVRVSHHIASGRIGPGAATHIRAAADVRAGIRAGAGAGADMRIKAADVQHSRPDRSVDRNLEDFVATLSGIELVLLVLAIVLPVSVITPLLAVLLFGRRCDRCGRLHAMRDTAHSRTETRPSPRTDNAYTNMSSPAPAAIAAIPTSMSRPVTDPTTYHMRDTDTYTPINTYTYAVRHANAITPGGLPTSIYFG